MVYLDQVLADIQKIPNPEPSRTHELAWVSFDHSPVSKDTNPVSAEEEVGVLLECFRIQALLRIHKAELHGNLDTSSYGYSVEPYSQKTRVKKI